MPGDELHDEAPRAASGPRHAAPRKPLLTRMHLPRGRAAAFAAMPTAMLMGMGLTPQLAAATPQPENPFQDGPCVSMPDQEAEEQEQERELAQDDAAKTAADLAAEVKQKAEAARKKAEAARKEAAEEAEKAAEARKQAREEAAAEREKAEREKAEQESDTSTNPPDSSADQDAGSEQESDTAEPEVRNPLDPLGLGDKLRDLLGIGEDEEAPDEQAEEPADEQPEKPAEKPAEEESADPADRVEQGLEETTDRLGEAADDVREGVEKQPGKTDQQQPEPAERPDSDNTEVGALDEDGKRPFPCVEEKKTAGTDETTPVVLPNQPWFLETSSLTLRGLKYHGVVNVTMVNGESKQVLKYTAESADIRDLHQTLQGPDGRMFHVEAAEGSTSTVRDGLITMYTEELAGNLFGVIPVVFTPERPPPLDLPFALFTNAKIRQAGQFGGNLTVPGLHSYFGN